MRAIAIICVAAGLTMAGCSKQGADSGAEDLVEGTEQSASPSGPAPQLKAALDTVDKNLEAKQYDAAMQTLLQAKIAAQTEADERLYREKMHQATQTLLEQSQTDPQARQTYETLGRAVQGR